MCSNPVAPIDLSNQKMNDEHAQLQHILERGPEYYLIQGFEEAPTNVLQLFVERAEDPEFQHKKNLRSQVKAMLESRRNDASEQTQKNSEESVALGKENLKLSAKSLTLTEESVRLNKNTYNVTRIVLWVSVVAAAAALIQLLLELFQMLNRQ